MAREEEDHELEELASEEEDEVVKERRRKSWELTRRRKSWECELTGRRKSWDLTRRRKLKVTRLEELTRSRRKLEEVISEEEDEEVKERRRKLEDLRVRRILGMLNSEEKDELKVFHKSAREEIELYFIDWPPHHPQVLHRVPERLRKMKESAYTPGLVSIGPIHKNAAHLKDMEKLKLSYMHHYLNQTKEAQTISQMETRTKKNLRQCMKAMLDMVSDVRNFYSVKFEGLSNVQFAKMMLIDGCFVLTYLMSLHFLCSNVDSRLRNSYINDLAKSDDPIFSSLLGACSVRQELLLLENQIPYSVLQKLRDNCKDPRIPPLPTLVFKFFETVVTFGGSAIAKSRFYDYILQGRPIPHILHLLHISILPLDLTQGKQPSLLHDSQQSEISPFVSVPIESQQSEFVPFVPFPIELKESEFANVVRHSATELDRSGLKFVAGEGMTLELKFSTSETNSTDCYSWMRRWCARSTVEIPKLYICDSTEPLLRNLIAYEQCYTGKHLYLTSYAYLMDTLIDSVEDVELLEKAGVIQNNLGSSEKVVHLFNNLCNETFLGQTFYFFKEWKKVDKYCKQWWPRNLAKLRRDYFSNPWTLISVIAALFLFILTLLQTVFTILG